MGLILEKLASRDGVEVGRTPGVLQEKLEPKTSKQITCKQGVDVSRCRRVGHVWMEVRVTFGENVEPGDWVQRAQKNDKNFRIC